MYCSLVCGLIASPLGHYVDCVEAFKNERLDAKLSCKLAWTKEHTLV